MKSIDLVKALNILDQKYQKRFFQLKELCALTSVSAAAASMSLIRAAQNGLVFRVKSLWVNLLHPPNLEDLALALISPSYISFETALYQHHILSQSPQGGCTLASTKRPQKIETPLGNIQVYHLQPKLFWGYDEKRLAFPEKAWLDLLYLRQKKGLKLSEVFYTQELNVKKLREFERKFPKVKHAI